MKPLILASSSPYRQTLLRQLGLDFIAEAPDIDETALTNEAPEALAQRLACHKARALKGRHPNALIIGSDQVAWCDGKQLNKPGNFDNALTQLQHSRGKTVTFYTGLCLYNSSDDSQQLSVESYRATFRSLSNNQLRSYLSREQPYDCAGSFKCEGLGISLFTSLAGDDPNTLIGLPLIRLTSMLCAAGLDPLASAE
ncbi:Maf family protein [Gilvimarinus polysaccharolyticus]|uniref:Maf family protein n=1 Tax=Gilvimarinus polysaccharolyticus TaxID=863921 RepID=UPI0006737BAC|nr:Maf family nucleotide pyrophosphatase [Gilvimarinus polysaccharolyticus]